MRSPKKHLGFNSLLHGLRLGFEKFKDFRRAGSAMILAHDVGQVLVFFRSFFGLKL